MQNFGLTVFFEHSVDSTSRLTFSRLFFKNFWATWIARIQWFDLRAIKSVAKLKPIVRDERTQHSPCKLVVNVPVSYRGGRGFELFPSRTRKVPLAYDPF